MFSFKHALTQDVVYGSLLERRRRQYHVAAGIGLEELYAERPDEIVELLVHHFGRGGEDEKAVDYGIRAAEKAQRHWAYTEAVNHFDGALTRLAAMPDTEPNRLRRIDAVVKQAEIRFALGQHAEHVHTLEAIRHLVEQAADPLRRAAWYCWAGFLHSLTGARTDVPIAYCREASAIAEANGLEEVPRNRGLLPHSRLRARGQPPRSARGGGARAGCVRGAGKRVVGLPDALGPEHGRERLGGVGRAAWSTVVGRSSMARPSTTSD